MRNKIASIANTIIVTFFGFEIVVLCEIIYKYPQIIINKCEARVASTVTYSCLVHVMRY